MIKIPGFFSREPFFSHDTWCYLRKGHKHKILVHQARGQFKKFSIFKAFLSISCFSAKEGLKAYPSSEELRNLIVVFIWCSTDDSRYARFARNARIGSLKYYAPAIHESLGSSWISKLLCALPVRIYQPSVPDQVFSHFDDSRQEGHHFDCELHRNYVFNKLCVDKASGGQCILFVTPIHRGRNWSRYRRRLLLSRSSK